MPPRSLPPRSLPAPVASVVAKNVTVNPQQTAGSGGHNGGGGNSGGDGDPEIQKAIAMSLQDHGGVRKRFGSILRSLLFLRRGISKRTAGPSSSADDELARAIELSRQTHNGGPTPMEIDSTGTRLSFELSLLLRSITTFLSLSNSSPVVK